ncbi:hypothetical protein IQ264_05675 [Phormidium sp. LEGE 05292]|uniref:hypothetical protein n=1 Tax=[Phormidium] sp. LEGE 05292 TaxID=767427 RepID=UPI00188175DC|nr:hypothetical protein [Phormidium sp. LEGE 05292]MBE9224954.1 hypothetical protein [Phormidium sp. LEGE 05292]
MEIDRPNAKEPTAEELAQLERLKGIIEKAMADGKITSHEYQNIKKEIYAHGKVSTDQFYREIELYRSLVQEKLEKGELEYDAPGM